MWTKICGTTNLDDAQLAAELGADAIGFVFAESKRQVTAEQVAAITSRLPSSVDKVGVFDRADVPWIADTVRHAGLTAVQLHFAFSADLLERLQAEFEGRVRLIGVVRVPLDEEHEGQQPNALDKTLREAFGRPELFAVLLDAAQGARSGGLGQPFAWDRVAARVAAARAAAERELGEAVPHLVVAGGLRAENLAEAVDVLRPWGVDVVSGVEAAPGVKSPERLSRFLRLSRAM